MSAETWPTVDFDPETHLLPKDLAGFQALMLDNEMIRLGDLLVCGGLFAWADDCVGSTVGHLRGRGFNVYRRMPCPKQGDSDDGFVNPQAIAAEKIRTFATGATRDVDVNKLDFEGFLSPECVRVFAEYMHTHRVQPDGKLRASDNWQKGIPRDAYMKSLFRHFMDLWRLHRGHKVTDNYGREITKREALCACWFNIQGYLLEELKEVKS